MFYDPEVQPKRSPKQSLSPSLGILESQTSLTLPSTGSKPQEEMQPIETITLHHFRSRDDRKAKPEIATEGIM